MVPVTFIAVAEPLVAARAKSALGAANPEAVPERAMLGLLFAVIERLPERLPFAVPCGWTTTVQEAPAARVVVPLTQVPPVFAKLVVFEREIETAVEVALPVLDKVKVTPDPVAWVPWVMPATFIAVAEPAVAANASTAAGAMNPDEVPARAMLGLLLAVTVRLPEIFPFAVACD